MTSSSNLNFIYLCTTAKVIVVTVMSASNMDVMSSTIGQVHAVGVTQYHPGSALLDQLNDGYM